MLGAIAFVSFSRNSDEIGSDKLRQLYAQSPGKWPSPTIDDGVNWKELGILPGSPIEKQKDSLKHVIELGKILFFDTRLSSSGKISCASCHQPELSWTDGKERSIGHEGAVTKRNSPTIQNSWFYEKLFWDGRAKDLADQAFAPINSETEMHTEMPDLVRRMRVNKEYPGLFKKAFGDEDINPDRLAEAIAIFEKTIVSRKSRFDEFLSGDKNVLSDSEIRGLHLFRTKARCMNCHHGPLFSDNQFHNNGFYPGTNAQKDKGLYSVTHKDEDMGKFKTPSLRDVMKTGPWMHDGSLKNIRDIITIYTQGSASPRDGLIKQTSLRPKETEDLIAFLQAISSPPLEFTKPVIPR